MHEHLTRTLHEFLAVKNSVSAIRLRLVGGILDCAKLEQNGFVKIHEELGSAIWEQAFPTSAHDRFERVTVRLWLSKLKNYMREVRAYGHPRAEPVYRVQTDTLDDIFERVSLILTNALSVPCPDSAEEEWDIIASDRRLVHDSEQYTPTMRKALIVDDSVRIRLAENPPLAARMIVGAARAPQYCPNSHVLASLAESAARLVQRREAAMLMLEALRRNDLNAPAWNSLGCAFHYLTKREEALRCFINAAEQAPAEDLYSGNIWLEGRNVLPSALKSSRFHELRSWCQRCLACGHTANANDKASVLTMLGLAYEAEGDIDEASSYYELALKESESFQPAVASRNRLQWDSAPLRSTACAAVIESFPALPEEVGTGGRIPLRFVEDGVHGSHWAAVTPDVESFIEQSVPESVRRGRLHANVRLTPGSMSDSDMEEAALFADHECPSIRHCIVTLRRLDSDEPHELVSFFPVGVDGTPNTLRIVRFLEWSNHVEGQVEAATRDGKMVTFFAPNYISDKETLQPNCFYEVRLSAFVSELEKSGDVSWEIAEGPLLELERERLAEEDEYAEHSEVESVSLGLSPDAAILEPLAASADEYHFYLKAGAVDWFVYNAARVCRIVCTLMKGCDEDDDEIKATLYAGEHVLNDYCPQEGDRIEGVLWLQGVVSPEPLERIEPDTPTSYKNLFDHLESPLDAYRSAVGAKDDLRASCIRTVHANVSGVPGVDHVELLAGHLDIEPDTVVWLTNDTRAFVYTRALRTEPGGEFTSDEAWMQKRAQYAGAKNISPVFFVEVCRTPQGEGMAIAYRGLDELRESLPKLAGLNP